MYLSIHIERVERDEEEGMCCYQFSGNSIFARFSIGYLCL